jgi:putative Mg2+ transporter-C (MgtC) family protein
MKITPSPKPTNVASLLRVGVLLILHITVARAFSLRTIVVSRPLSPAVSNYRTNRGESQSQLVCSDQKQFIATRFQRKQPKRTPTEKISIKDQECTPNQHRPLFGVEPKPFLKRVLWRVASAINVSILLILASPSIASASTEAMDVATWTLTSGIVRPVSFLVELQLTARLIYAALMGVMLGKGGDNHSGTKCLARVPTMALVSMGAAAFTVCSGFGFIPFGPYDRSRMAAHVVSGVALVGAALISTTIRNEQPTSQPMTNVVDGLTTAAAIWLSAAIGVACGVGLYVVATTAAVTTTAFLRMGSTIPKGQATQRPNSDQSPVQTLDGQKLTVSTPQVDGPHCSIPQVAEGVTAQDPLEDHHAETRNPSVLDEPSQTTSQSASDSIHYQKRVPPNPSPTSPVREKYQSKSAREDRYSLRGLDDPMSHPLVQHAWRQSNSTTYNDIKDMTFEELERFVQRHKPSTSFLEEKKKNDDSQDQHHP